MRLTADQRASKMALDTAARGLVAALRPPLDLTKVEEALADLVAQGRLTTVALGLNADRMRSRARARWNEDLC